MAAQKELQTAWLKAPHETGGLDHLGVKAPVIHIFGDLLPGITNVTDRARYYSFYPWLIWRLDKAQIRDWTAEARRYVRRADCLFTLIANYHDLVTDDDSGRHSPRLVGNDTLGKVAHAAHEGATVDLARYATEEEGSDRYFKNKLGGLGQYYIGSLRDVLLLGGDAASGLRYTNERGVPTAEAFDAAVEGERFWRCIETGTVAQADLEAMVSFCPCHLHSAEQERDRLLDIFFARDEFAIDAGRTRRASLRLLLHLAGQLDAIGAPLDVAHFRGCVYAAALPGEGGWSLPTDLGAARARWATYVTNEVLSVGLQGLFFATLEWLQQYEPARDAREMAAWFMEDEPGQVVVDALGDVPLARLLDKVEKQLPGQAQWQHAAHEYALARAVVDNTDRSAEGLGRMATDAARGLASLAIRLRATDSPYEWLTFPPGYFDAYPLNLRAFQRNLAEWQTMTVAEWLQELIAKWCINAHIRVALNKLRKQSKGTFQVQPTDRGFVIKGAPEPEFSNPRFRQARQMLIDTGCLAARGDDRFACTPLGKDMLADG